MRGLTGSRRCAEGISDAYWSTLSTLMIRVLAREDPAGRGANRASRASVTCAHCDSTSSASLIERARRSACAGNADSRERWVHAWAAEDQRLTSSADEELSKMLRKGIDGVGPTPMTPKSWSSVSYLGDSNHSCVDVGGCEYKMNRTSSLSPPPLRLNVLHEPVHPHIFSRVDLDLQKSIPYTLKDGASSPSRDEESCNHLRAYYMCRQRPIHHTACIHQAYRANSLTSKN